MVIKARLAAVNSQANLSDYDSLRRSFSWDSLEKELDWPRRGRINIVHPAIDRWAEDARWADKTALIFESSARMASYTFADLRDQSCRWANLLAEMGYSQGDRLFIFLRPSPETLLVILACARLGVLFCPLNHSLSYDDLEIRFHSALPKGVVTETGLAAALPQEAMAAVELEHLILIDDPDLERAEGEDIKGTWQVLAAPDRLARVSARRKPKWLRPAAPLYLLFTSGSTGPPKGIVHAHKDAVGILASARYALNLSPDSILWTDAAPSWVTGTVYSCFGPWLIGATSVVQGDDFMASTWYRTLERHRVTAWYTTPNTIRGLIAAGDDLPGRYNLTALEHIACVGETLPPEHYYWTYHRLGHVANDTWWMTETGMICLANFPALDTKPGSIGKPLPGIEAEVLDEEGQPLPALAMGQLALRGDLPALMISTWRDKRRFKEYFRLEGWFLTGDVALKDDEGYFYHQGRLDDLIKVDKHFVGPFEIEQVLIQHPAVHETAAISLNAATTQPTIKAFVVLGPGYAPSTRLAKEIKAFLKANLSHAIPLSEITFLDQMPKTVSNKILRRALRAAELGLPVGDTRYLKD